MDKLTERKMAEQYLALVGQEIANVTTQHDQLNARLAELEQHKADCEESLKASE